MRKKRVRGFELVTNFLFIWWLVKKPVFFCYSCLRSVTQRAPGRSFFLNTKGSRSTGRDLGSNRRRVNCTIWHRFPFGLIARKCIYVCQLFASVAQEAMTFAFLIQGRSQAFQA